MGLVRHLRVSWWGVEEGQVVEEAQLCAAERERPERDV